MLKKIKKFKKEADEIQTSIKNTAAKLRYKTLSEAYAGVIEEIEKTIDMHKKRLEFYTEDFGTKCREQGCVKKCQGHLCHYRARHFGRVESIIRSMHALGVKDAQIIAYLNPSVASKTIDREV